MLHAELMQFCPDYRVLQTKEKFGGLRAYIAPPHDEGIQPEQAAARKQAYALEYKYEALSHTVCEYCGKQGTNRPDKHGWYKTFCEEHHQRRADDPMWKWA